MKRGIIIIFILLLIGSNVVPSINRNIVNISNYEVPNTKNNSILKTNENITCYIFFIGTTKNFIENDTCYNITFDMTYFFVLHTDLIGGFGFITDFYGPIIIDKEYCKFIGIINDNFIFAIMIQYEYIPS